MYISTLDLEHQYDDINDFSRILSYPEDAACVLLISCRNMNNKLPATIF